MPPTLPPPELTITRQHARRFLLAHHRLLPPRKLRGKQGVLDYMRHVNCIQYDPINVVGQNPHLVLQSRVKGYKAAMLDEALYSHESTVKAAKLMDWVKREIKTRGPLSSLDLDEETRVEWWLNGTTRAVGIALDILFISGDIVVHHRVGTRRYFE